jgi:uncharacterized membrane protein
MTSGRQEGETAGTRIFFERVLLPYRSLPRQHFRLLMLILGLVSLGVGISFVSIGAWPVCGFFGLDVALLYLAFQRNYRSARQREKLRLSGTDFTVEKVDVRGEQRIWRFQPFWLRVVLEVGRDHSNRLLLTSHGRSLAIGEFMPPPARHELARTLTEALLQWKSSLPGLAQDC